MRNTLLLATVGCWAKTAVMGAIVDPEQSTEIISTDDDASNVILGAIAALAVSTVLLVTMLKFAFDGGGESTVDENAELPGSELELGGRSASYHAAPTTSTTDDDHATAMDRAAVNPAFAAVNFAFDGGGESKVDENAELTGSELELGRRSASYHAARALAPAEPQPALLDAPTPSAARGVVPSVRQRTQGLEPPAERAPRPVSTTNPELEELPPDPVLEGHSDDDELPPGPEKPLRWRDPCGSDAEFSDGDEAGWDSDSDASDEETNWRAEVVAEANRSTVCSLSDEEDTLETAVAATAEL